MGPTSSLSGVEGRWASVGSGLPGSSRILLAHFRLIRPTTRLWLDTLMPVAVLAVASGGAPPLPETALFVLAMNLIHIGATIFNDIHDVEIDRLSVEAVRQRRPVAQGVISVRLARREAVAAIVLGLAAAFVSSVVVGLIMTLVAVVTLLHEIPPVRVQGRTVVAQLYTTVGLAVLVGALMFLAPQPQWDAAIPFGIYVVLYLGLCETLVKDIRDVDNDTNGGKRTTAVRYGAARATAAAAVAYLVTAGVWVWFVLQTEALAALLLFGTVVFVGWACYVIGAARRLSREFSKSTCISLHKGSALVFSVLNVVAAAAVQFG